MAGYHLFVRLFGLMALVWTAGCSAVNTPGASSSVPAPVVNQPNSGAISGALSFPSEGIPPLRVVAFSTTSQGYAYIDTSASATKSTYIMRGLQPGTYHVVAYSLPAQGFTAKVAGGYTRLVQCQQQGTECDDHRLIDVVVKPNETTTGVDPADWFGPDGAFPPSP